MRRHKYVIEFPEHLQNILSVLADKKNTTMAEIVRRALAVYSYLNAEHSNGSRIIIINPETNQFREVDFMNSGRKESIYQQRLGESVDEYFQRAVRLANDGHQRLLIMVGFGLMFVDWNTTLEQVQVRFQKYLAGM